MPPFNFVIICDKTGFELKGNIPLNIKCITQNSSVMPLATVDKRRLPNNLCSAETEMVRNILL